MNATSIIYRSRSLSLMQMHASHALAGVLIREKYHIWLHIFYLFRWMIGEIASEVIFDSMDGQLIRRDCIGRIPLHYRCRLFVDFIGRAFSLQSLIPRVNPNRWNLLMLKRWLRDFLPGLIKPLLQSPSGRLREAITLHRNVINNRRDKFLRLVIQLRFRLHHLPSYFYNADKGENKFKHLPLFFLASMDVRILIGWFLCQTL